MKTDLSKLTKAELRKKLMGYANAPDITSKTTKKELIAICEEIEKRAAENKAAMLKEVYAPTYSGGKDEHRDWSAIAVWGFGILLVTAAVVILF